MFYKFHENISLIKEKIPDCKVDVFYSFWDDPSRSERINDPWHYIADDYVQQVINHDNIICLENVVVSMFLEKFNLLK